MDFYFENCEPLALGTPKEKFENNLAAIRLAKQLATSARAASPDEQAVLSRYVGWGDSALLRQLNGMKDVDQLMTEDELRSARGSSLNAHYTDLPVISAMWTGLTHLGLGTRPFRALDPAAGIGHFRSTMPVALRDQAEWVEIELDTLTAQILKLLHPKSRIYAQGYEKTDLPAGWFDLAISNIPFGDYGVFKRDLPSFLRKAIHDFFFSNTVALLRPGGILAFITSRYTMDKKLEAVRSWLGRRLDLLAAVRLPETTFKANAGTEVVTDILFLQKRVEEAKTLPAWIQTGEFKESYRTANVNQYFLQNPQMVLGAPSFNGTMYRSDGYTVESDGRDLGQAIKESLCAVLPKGLLSTIPEEVKIEAMPQAPREIVVTLSASKPADEERVNGLKQIYLAAKQLLAAETSGGSIVDTSVRRSELNKVYDSFTARYGPINKPANIRLLSGTPEAPFLKALELYNPTSATAKKADLFTTQIVRSATLQSDELSVDDALLVCLDNKGKLDLGYIAKLCKATTDWVIAHLKGRIYSLPDGKGWVMADEYLSGNVRVKLREAKAAAALDDSFQENVVALESVIPPDLKNGIRAPLGAGWIPVEYIRQFILHLLKDGEYKVAYLPHLAHWEIEDLYRWRISDSLAKSRWGTQRIHALELIDAGLNSRSVTISDEVDEKTRVVNQMETVAAQAKLGEIKDEFERWLWSDPERATELRSLYNEQFNAFCPRRYDGSHLSTPGLNRNITLRPHQKNVVWRILQNQSTAVDHRVGAGKTLAGIVAAMEAKRLWLVKKTMIVVPNHLLSQWQLAALAAYPGANVLAPSPTDFEKANRGEFLSKIATNDWDIVLVPFSSFKLIPVSRKTMEEFYQREIDTLETYLYELKVEEGRSPSRATKEIEKNKKRFEAKLEALADMKKDHQGTITFEEMGVEMLIVDEFHAFKNLFFQSHMTRIAGLNNTDSQRAFDMFMKMIWMQEHGYKTVPMSGTFIVNTIAEFFTMQKFMQLGTLKSLGIAHFDAWANQFALAEPGLEMTPDGSGFRMNTRFRKFVNVPELMKIWLQVADVYMIDETSGIERPHLINGKPVKVLSDGGEELVQYVKELATRAEKVRSGLVRPDQDNMLVITSDGRKAALDLSLVIPKPPNSPMPKIDELVNLVAEIYNSTSPVQATQLIFCDLATPKARS